MLQERLTHLEKGSEELSQQHRKELAQLEAALAGAEAAKKQLQEQQAQHSTAGEPDLQAANAAQVEAEARALSLQGQIDTLRAQAAASRSYLQDEANSLKVPQLPYSLGSLLVFQVSLGSLCRSVGSLLGLLGCL